MPRLNIIVILIALVIYALCLRVTVRDRILVESLHRLEEKALVEPKPRELFESAMTGMTQLLKKKYDDEYSAYIPFEKRKIYEDDLDNRFEGIGIQHGLDPVENMSEILYPIPGSPAFQAGFRSGDRILRVNGTDTKGLTPMEITELFKVKDPNLDVLLRQYETGEIVEKKLRRAPIQYESIEGDAIDTQGKRRFFLETEPEIAYLKLTSFSVRTPGEVAAALREIVAASPRGLILDLRENPGGYVPECVEVAGFFLSPTENQNAVVSTHYRNGKEKDVYRLARNTKICDLPMVVLIDGDSASASEILAAALQDYGRATIVGTRSFGKGVVQELIPLPLKSGKLRVTGTSYWRPSNRNIHRHVGDTEADVWGVLPDPGFEVPVSEEQRYVQSQIRLWRGNIVSEKRQQLMEQWQTRLPEDIRKFHQRREKQREMIDTLAEAGVSEELLSELDEPPMEKDVTPKDFQFEGKAPYFDPQLDKAVEVFAK